MKKRGVSAVVATVLLIMITVAAVAVLWGTVVPLVKDSMKESTSENVQLSIETEGGYTTWDEVQKIARVQVKRGNDNTNLTGIDFSFIREGNTKKNLSEDVPQPNQVKVYEFNLSDFGKPEEIKIAPVTSEGVGKTVDAESEIKNYTNVSNKLGGDLDLCTVFTYSDWSECNSSGFRNRVILTSPPEDCINGAPLTIEECDYVEPCVSGLNGQDIVVCSCEDLQNMSVNVFGNYLLGQDVDCSDTLNWNYNSSMGAYQGFLPIGNTSWNAEGRYYYRFQGNFSGGGHTISNLFINRPTQSNIALFGDTIYNSHLGNVGVVNVNITGKYNVGALVGDMEYQTFISNCYSSGFVKGEQGIGGLIGGVGGNGAVSNSYSTAKVVGNSWVGGFTASTSSDITNSFSTGDVSGSAWFGGFFYSSPNYATNYNLFWNNKTTNPPVCYTSSNGYTGCTAIQDNEDYFYSKDNEPMASWDFTNIWQENVGGYPTLRAS